MCATWVPWWKCSGSFAPGAMVTRWRYSSCPGPLAGAACPSASRVMPLLVAEPAVVGVGVVVEVVVCAAADAPVARTTRTTSATKARVIDREVCIRTSSAVEEPPVGTATPRGCAVLSDHPRWGAPKPLVKPRRGAHTRAMTTVLVVFHTAEGQTAKIADHVAAVLRDLGDDVEVHDVAGAPAPEHYDGVVVGDSIHAVHHSKALTRYVNDHVVVLNKLPTALFQVSLTSANPDDEHTATAQELVHELLDRTGFDPDLVGLFAGALVYTR